MNNAAAYARHHRIRPAASACTAMVVAALIVGCASAEPPMQDPGTSSTPTTTLTPETVAPTETAESSEPPSFDKTAHSIDDPSSIWVVSNKTRPLNPIDVAPDDLVMPVGVENEFAQPLREPAARAAEQMLGAATNAGLPIRIISAYRDYGTQVALYNGYVARDGQAAADRYSARPGHSEHQTGLVIDLDDHTGCYLDDCFGDTPTGVWLSENAAEFGYVERYPGEKEEITGFMPEPWHFRYVGPELALEMRAQGVSTLEEFFGLPAAPGYAG